MTTLTTTSLSCRRGSKALIDNLSLTTSGPEVIGITGPNGSGKSTLLHTLAGLRQPTSGTVRLDDHDLHQLKARARARAIAFVGQDETPAEDLLVREVVAMGRLPYAPPWSSGDDAPIDDALAAADLTGFADRPITQLSGGESKRVLIARALIQDAPIMMLDEPTNHLDIAHRLRLLELVRGLGRTVLMALHDLSLTARFCDRVLVVAPGGQHVLGTPELALDPAVISQVFGVRAIRVKHPETGLSHLLFEPSSGEKL